MKQLMILMMLLLPVGSIATDWQSVPLRENGTIPIWTVLGPLPNTNSSGGDAGLYKDYLVSAGGEDRIIPTGDKQIIYDINKAHSWKFIYSYNSGLLDYIEIFESDKQTPGVAYAFCMLHSEMSQKIRLLVRSDDGVRIWLNGDLIHDKYAERGINEEEDQVIARLNQGDNRLMVKVDQRIGEWGLKVTLTDLDNNKPEGITVKYSSEKAYGTESASADFLAKMPVMKKNGNEVLPVSVHIASNGLENAICRFSNPEWTDSQDFELGDLSFGKHILEINLKIPPGNTDGPINANIISSGVPLSETGWIIKQYLGSELMQKEPELYISPSSHQDIAWMDSPEQCIEDRDRLIITPALKLLRNNPDYHYDVEDALMLVEYLERHPERTEEVQKYTCEGRLLWGGTYTQPYESLYSGESLVRQLYFGRKLVKQLLPGCDTRTAFSPDVPGRALQIPQIFHKAGIKYLVFSRFAPGIYNMNSPDGTGVVAISPGHYHHQSEFVRKTNLQEYLISLNDFLINWEPFYLDNNIKPVIPVLASTDMSSPLDFSGLTNQIDQSAGKVYTEKGVIRRNIPRPEYSTSQKALDALMRTNPQLPEISGERPNVWLYIHGPTHHKAVSFCREAAVLLPSAEKFNTISCLLKNDMETYPASALKDGWEGQVYPDHGWGGFNGQVTDNLFSNKFRLARDTGEEYLNIALKDIAGNINTAPEHGLPLVVFNDLSWKRTEAVQQKLTFDYGKTFSVGLKDHVGQDVPLQMMSEKYYDDGSLKSAVISFIAENIPSIGYKTYYVRPLTAKVPREIPLEHSDEFENEFYKITFTAGGIKQIFDKELDRELLITDKFLGGEIFTMRSEGNGAGEFAEIQQPTMEGFDKVSNHKPNWELSKTGILCTVYSLKQKLEHCTIRQAVTIYNSIKQIDFHTEILDWDGTHYREFRQAFPLHMEGGEVAYEVAFGKVRVGKDEIEGDAGERYVQTCSEMHPREVQNWISSGTGDFSITLSSSVAVCDWIDPATDPVKYPVLQPVLLASRRSCHGYGNWYLQQGDHDYRFSLFSEKQPQLGSRKATGVNHPFQTVLLLGSTVQNGELPLEQGFVSCDRPNVVISTIKKCEDDDNIILRCYETDGTDTDATITFFRPFKSAEQTNIIEEEGTEIKLRKGQLKIHIGHHSIETYKLEI